MSNTRHDDIKKDAAISETHRAQGHPKKGNNAHVIRGNSRMMATSSLDPLGKCHDGDNHMMGVDLQSA